jgi:hypothetical protein
VVKCVTDRGSLCNKTGMWYIKKIGKFNLNKNQSYILWLK